MNLLQKAIFALSYLCLPGAAFANGDVGDFNFNETTGLINIPAARVAPEWSLQLSPQFQGVGRTLSGPNGYKGPAGFKDLDDSFGGNDGSFRGILGLPGRVELSAMALHGNVNSLVFGGKWLAIEDADDHPAFAVGVQSIRTHLDEVRAHPANFDDPSFFGVVGHTFKLNDDGLALELQVGWGSGRLKNGFVGGEVHITKNVSLIGEYDGTIRSAAIRITPHPRWEIMPAVQFQSNQQVHVGLSVSYRIFNDGVAEPERASEKAETHKEKSAQPNPP